MNLIEEHSRLGILQNALAVRRYLIHNNSIDTVVLCEYLLPLDNIEVYYILYRAIVHNSDKIAITN